MDCVQIYPEEYQFSPREELITAAMEAHLTLMVAVEKHPDATLAYKAMIMEIAKVIQRATIIMEEDNPTLATALAVSLRRK